MERSFFVHGEKKGGDKSNFSSSPIPSPIAKKWSYRG
jgi:hypothetical protein